MRINRLAVTGYKNLIDCEIFPRGVHAITGCNGAGKSNLLEVLSFVAALQGLSDEARHNILQRGNAPSGDSWFPEATTKAKLQAFRFALECIVQANKKTWLVTYTLEIVPEAFESAPYPRIARARIGKEALLSKRLGTTGKAKTLLVRSSEGNAIAYGGRTPRARQRYRCKENMSALHALETREADLFAKHYPVISAFRNALLATEIVRLDLERFRQALVSFKHAPLPAPDPGRVIHSYDPYHLLRQIEKNPSDWRQFNSALSRLVGVDRLHLYESDPPKNKKGKAITDPDQIILARQHGRFTSTYELSMGATAAISFLTSLYSLMRRGGAAIFEEPENYLHPKALIELVSLFREFSEDHTIIFSTHSPVALNSMKPSEVTVMQSVGHGFVTTRKVSDIKEAIDALNRGFLSFGDLLQTNFTEDGCGEKESD